MAKSVKKAPAKKAAKAAGPKLKFGSPEWRKKHGLPVGKKKAAKKVVKKGK